MLNMKYIAMMLRPIVEHGLDELGRYDKKTVHTMYEVAIMSYLVAMGYSPMVAIKMFEKWEEMYGELEMYESEEEYRYRY